ncbi:hypothetical protein ACFFUB_10340 [Algimonas porphyrae]|uniref:DUF2282 domain-containing protein n=1 Tax=Algimonas porphyrae TaxID=1128113 RepID=A0ABQ5V3Q7_9PROT|nr:hypothetical protein [Algimonas porphyrae]GLQ21488.1 hypothetical protein GCM10007854_24430 [Algimonas porphyrae]
MKILSIFAVAMLGLAACTTTVDETKSDDMMTNAMVAPTSEERCDIRDDDGTCLCIIANANGQCEQGGGTVIIQGGGTNPGGSVDAPDQ